MAEELQLGIKVTGNDSLAAIKSDIKSIQNEIANAKEGTIEYDNALKKLKDRDNDLKQFANTINTLNPEGKIAAFQNVASKIAGGFQAATGAAALLGIQSEDLQQQLLKVQAATAFAEGIRSISGLGDAFAVVSTVIKTNVVAAFGTLKAAIATTGIGALVVLLGYLVVEFVKSKEVTEEATEAQEDYNKAIEDGNEALKKRRAIADQVVSAEIAQRNARDGGINQLQRELSLLNEKGATELEINNVKRQIIKEELANLEIQKKIAGTISLDQKGLLEIEEQIKDKKHEAILLDERDNKKKTESLKQETRERFEYEKITNQEVIDRYESLEKEKTEFNLKYEQETYAINKRMADEEERQRKEKEAAEKQAAADALLLKQQMNQAKIQSESNAFNAFQGLSEAYFQTQLNSAKGNAVETDKIRKKQFETEKAFSIARAVIDGVRAVQGALAQAAVLGPFAGVLAASYGILAAANVAKIASTQYNSSSTGASTTAPTFAGVQAPIPTNPVGPQTRQDATNLDNNGYVINLNANVYEGQMTDKQRRVNGLQRRASFG